MVVKRALIPIQLLETYGQQSMAVFYPDFFQTAHVITYRSVIELYNKCLAYKDDIAIAVLSDTYDINHIMAFDSALAAERPINFERTRYEQELIDNRNRYYKKHEEPKHFVGGVRFRNCFRLREDGTVICSARKIIYGMSAEAANTLLKMSESCCNMNLPALSLIEKYELLCKLPDRDSLLLFYLRYMVDQSLPADDWEALRDGKYRFVDKVSERLPRATIDVNQ